MIIEFGDLDFIRECFDEIWDAGADSLSQLPNWAVGWRRGNNGTVYKEADTCRVTVYYHERVIRVDRANLRDLFESVHAA